MDINLVDYFAYAIGLLSQLGSLLPDLFTWLPGEVVAFILPALGICIVYRILGWGG